MYLTKTTSPTYTRNGRHDTFPQKTCPEPIQTQDDLKSRRFSKAASILLPKAVTAIMTIGILKDFDKYTFTQAQLQHVISSLHRTVDLLEEEMSK